MSVLSMPLRLTGARILGDGGFEARALTIADGVVTTGPAPELDLSGHDILPGIVDLVADPAGPLSTTDATLAAQGVTTAWLAHDWTWHGPCLDETEAGLSRLRLHRRRLLTDLRALLRCDTHMMDHEARLLTLLQRGDVDMVLFADRLTAGCLPSDPHQRRKAEALAARSGEVHRHLCNLAHAFDALGLPSGSHRDRDGQARERLAMMGAKICAAPRAVGAAAVARAWGDPVLLPALGVLHRDGTAGPPDVCDLITSGMCDALISDGTPAALPRAALHLAQTGLLPVAGAWSLVSARPAAIAGLTDRGRLAPGMRADLVVFDRKTRRITATMTGGHWSWRHPDVVRPAATRARKAGRLRG